MSIFRYPGGKGKLLKVIRPQIDLAIKNGAAEYHEPCVGGGAVVISIAKDYPRLKLHINDHDLYMYAFWQTIVAGHDEDIEQLYSCIRQTPTVARFRSLCHEPSRGIVDMAYRAVFYNRTSFSGIRGAGVLGGYSQSGQYRITDRYNPNKIIKDIQRVRFMLRGRTTVSQLSVIDYMQSKVDDNAIAFIDPPYFQNGNSLYLTGMNHQEHQALAKVLQSKSNWVLSYDRCQPIAEMYDFAARLLVPVKYSVTAGGTRRGTQFEYLILPLGMPVAAASAAMAIEPKYNVGLKWVA